MIQDVDHSAVINAHIIESPVLGAITPKDLSGGVKVLILMLKDDSFIYNLSDCGNNCAKWVLKIAETKDLNYYVYLRQEVGRTWEAALYPLKDTIIFIEENNHFVFSKEFAEFVKTSGNYFVLVNRSPLKMLLHAMLEAFLEFVTTRYNPDWYGQWKFELWKSPGEPLKSYITGYRTIARIIRKSIPKAAFGDPGYNTGYPPDGLTECLTAFRDAGLRPDFISVHFFSIQSINSAGNEKLVLPSDEDTLCTQQKWILAQIEKILGPGCPLYITEFNFSLLPDCFVSSSCYQAAFLCMNLLELHESSDMIGYRVLSDMGFNILVPDRFSSFSIGLINNNGIKMPSYHAYNFLNKLGDHLIEKNENYCITCTDENHYQVLAYHYVHFLDFLFLQEKDKNTLRKVYSPFKKSPAFQMTIRLTDLRPGVYRIKRNLLDRFHGSLIDIKLGELLNGTIDDETFIYKTLTLSPQEKAYLTAACVPEERTIYQNIRDELVLTTPLYPHNVCLWEVVKEY